MPASRDPSVLKVRHRLVLHRCGHDDIAIRVDRRTSSRCTRSTTEVETGQHVGDHRARLRRPQRVLRLPIGNDALPVVLRQGGGGGRIKRPYASMAAVAVGGGHALIVETRLAHEFQWIALIQKLAPRRPLIISTVKGVEHDRRS